MVYDLIKISALPAATPDESQEIVVGVGDLAKRINYGDVKADMVGTSPSYTTDTEPYLMRQTAHTGVVGKCALNKLVGGSLGWNQLCNGSSVTVPSGHKYYMKKSGTASIGASTGSAITGLTSGTDMVIDLTAAFGSTIADYVYGLEQATAGAGVAWLSRYIDLGTYHAYDAGSIQSVQATAHVTTGFNQFDEVVEAGYWDATTGQKASGGNWMRCANYIPVLPNTEYMIHFSSGSGSQGSIIYLDGNKAVISYASSYIGTIITTPSNCRYMVFYANNGWFGGNICINISKTSGTPKNGDYVPYNGHSYPLGSDTLRGIPQLVSNKLAFDGDIKTPDGTIRRKYGTIDLGAQTWSYNSSVAIFYCNVPAIPLRSAWLVPRYDTSTVAQVENIPDKSIWHQNYAFSANNICIKDSAYSTAAALKTSLSGVYLVYPLTSETTESSTAYQKVQTIDADGTESFTTSSPVPVGHETQTPDNILAALGWLGE